MFDVAPPGSAGRQEPEPAVTAAAPGSASAPQASQPWESPPAAAAAAPAPAPAEHAAGQPTAAPRFGAQDPSAKARRLARALVSDMVTYHPERQQRALREGTLRTEFREEIRKSWEEYVEQVGKEVAHGTPYFRDALNEILARGQPLF